METRRRQGESTSEVLQRIQLETERVKRRLNSSCDSVSAASSFDNDDNLASGNGGTPYSSKSTGNSFKDQYLENYHKQQQQNRGRGNHQGVEVVARGGREAAPEYLVEPSSGFAFEDPVPSNQMSTHLKSEHEAFKAK